MQTRPVTTSPGRPLPPWWGRGTPSLTPGARPSAFPANFPRGPKAPAAPGRAAAARATKALSFGKATLGRLGPVGAAASIALRYWTWTEPGVFQPGFYYDPVTGRLSLPRGHLRNAATEAGLPSQLQGCLSDGPTGLGLSYPKLEWHGFYNSSTASAVGCMFGGKKHSLTDTFPPRNDKPLEIPEIMIPGQTWVYPENMPLTEAPPYAKPGLSINPRRWARPGIRPVGWDAFPGTAPRPVPLKGQGSKPPKGTRETKVRAKWVAMVQAAVNLVTESLEVLAALYEASGGSDFGASPQEQLEWLFGSSWGIGNLDPAELAKLLVANQIEDFVIGKLSSAPKGLYEEFGWLVGIETGPAL